MDVEDVRLSASQYDERHVTAPVSRHVLANMSRVKNSVPLPVPANKSGVRLPADRFCTTAVNYRLKRKRKIDMKSLSRTARDSVSSSSSSSSLTPGVDVDVPVFTLQYNDGQG